MSVVPSPHSPTKDLCLRARSGTAIGKNTAVCKVRYQMDGVGAEGRWAHKRATTTVMSSLLPPL